MQPRGVVLHLTASTFGDAAQVDQWHKANGWSGIGYHRLIQNGKRRASDAYDASRDGKVEKGRPDGKQGAHCRAGAMNACTYGVCCVGSPGTVPAGAKAAAAELVVRRYLTARQAAALADTVARLCIQHGWNPRGSFVHPVTGKTVPVISHHSDHDPANKPFCASLRLDAVRDLVAGRIAAIQGGGALEEDGAPWGAAFDWTDHLEAVAEDGVEPASDVPPGASGGEPR